MKDTTKFVGLDVAKETIAVAVADAGGGPARYWGQIVNTPEAVRKLIAKLGGAERLLACYEAGPTGYGLQRQLEEMGVACCVVAPSLTPVRPGDRVKTDRRDALRLAMLLRAGELTPVWVPDAAHEALRELVRAREEAVEDQRKARQRLGSLLLRHGVQPPKKMTRWKAMYMRWLETLKFETSALHTAYQEYLRGVLEAAARVDRLEMAIRDEVRRSPLEPVVRALQALRGVAELTAATAALEIADFTRFLKPSSLMSYTGLTPSERSSGATQRRGGISKTGNAHLRRVLVEAAWSYRHKPGVKGARKKRQEGLDPQVLAIAHKAEERLHRKYWRLLQRGKSPSVAAAAVARELVGFLWAIGCRVQTKQAAEQAA